MNDIVVRIPGPIAFISLVLGLPIFVFMAVACVLMTLLLHTLAGKFPLWGIVAGYFIFPAMVVFSCASILAGFRYGRESLFTTFRVNEHGINIENQRYDSLMLRWNEIESASYSRSLKIVVLRSRKLAAPIAFSNWKNFPEAVQKVKQNIGARWIEKWI
jgi:hypothetical protein